MSDGRTADVYVCIDCNVEVVSTPPVDPPPDRCAICQHKRDMQELCWREHTATTDCWCEPEEIAPGWWVHKL